MEKSELAAKESQDGRNETLWMTAEIRVLRSNPQIARDRIRLRFLEYAPNHGFIEPVPLPWIKTGQIPIFPLRENDDPSQPWRLVIDRGATGMTLPAHNELADSDPPATARAFILRELANAVAHGTRSELSRRRDICNFRIRAFLPNFCSRSRRKSLATGIAGPA